MPKVPVYQRQETYHAPSVERTSGAPRRLPQAYENKLTRLGNLTRQGLNWLTQQGVKSAPPKRENPADRSREISDIQQEVSLRKKMTSWAKEEVTQKGHLSARSLEKFAYAHLTPETAAGPAGQDYTVLQQAAHKEEALLSSRQLQQSLASEEEQVRKIGSLVASAEGLETYLTQQLPAYEAHLKEGAASPEEVSHKSDLLRAQVVEENICRAVCVGEWQAAERVFSAHQQALAPNVQDALQQKIRACYVRGETEKLWQQACLETDATPHSVRTWAKQKLEAEKDEFLRQEILTGICGLATAQEKIRLQETAQVYSAIGTCLDRLPQAWEMLNKQKVFTPQELSRAQEVLGKVPAAEHKTQEEWFVKLYFTATAEEIYRAFVKRKISGEDFFMLMAAAARRQSGAENAPSRWLCRGMEQYWRKKELPAGELPAVQRAVLAAGWSAQEQFQTWQLIKKLWEC